MGFLTVAIAIIATSILVLWGLRGTAAEVNDSWKHSEFNIPERRKDADHEPCDRAALDAQSSGGTNTVAEGRRDRADVFFFLSAGTHESPRC